MPVNSLDTRFSKSVMLRLLEEGEVVKTKLQDIVSNLYSLDRLLSDLGKEGFIKIEKLPYGKNIQRISLTAKGRLVAQKLKEADDIASGKSIPKETISIELPEGIHSQIIKILKTDKEHKSEADFVLDAVKEKIRKWKNDNP
jgi:DNA-binding MarR family transcriptional regulator